MTMTWAAFKAAAEAAGVRDTDTVAWIAFTNTGGPVLVERYTADDTRVRIRG